MIISLDYDGTFTKDPELWIQFIQSAKERGHRVVCVTMRSKEEATVMDGRLLGLVEMCFTNRKAKKQAARMQGIEPDIWIDDFPEWLFEDG